MRDVKTGKALYLEGKYDEALAFFLGGASEGCAECAFHYAYMKLRGVGTAVDFAEARTYFNLASHYVGEACYNLSVMYMHGLGTTRDYKKSFEYMNDAADMGVIEAQLYLGMAHTIGYLIEPNIISISLIPYHTPEFRDRFAMLEGEVPDSEEDEEKRIRAVRLDHRTAFEWFRESAMHPSDYVEELSQNAKYLYARCYLDGLGVDFNRDCANRLMLLAAADGSRDAMTYLETEAPYVLASVENKELIENIRKAYRLAPP